MVTFLCTDLCPNHWLLESQPCYVGKPMVSGSYGHAPVDIRFAICLWDSNNSRGLNKLGSRGFILPDWLFSQSIMSSMSLQAILWIRAYLQTLSLPLGQGPIPIQSIHDWISLVSVPSLCPSTLHLTLSHCLSPLPGH